MLWSHILMTKQLRKAKALIDSIFRGIEVPADTFSFTTYAYPHKSERDAMRGDWRRVGDDLRDAIKRTEGETAA
jgi:hypothetical protein